MTTSTFYAYYPIVAAGNTLRPQLIEEWAANTLSSADYATFQADWADWNLVLEKMAANGSVIVNPSITGNVFNANTNTVETIVIAREVVITGIDPDLFWGAQIPRLRAVVTDFRTNPSAYRAAHIV